MRLLLVKEMIDFYQKNGYLELQDLLSVSEADALKEMLTPFTSLRLAVNQKITEGYDLWRKSASAKKQIFPPKYASLVKELSQEQGLRIGFDQVLDFRQPLTSYRMQEALQVLPAASTLQEISSLNPLIGGMVVALDPIEPKEHTFPWPQNERSALFIKADLKMEWEKAYQMYPGRYLLIAFAPVQTTYQENLVDPHTYTIKQMDYRPGEPLQDRTHPRFT